METAMKEMINWLKYHRDNDKILMQQHVIAKAYELFEKEKQQIIKARQDGYESCDCEGGCGFLDGTNEEYYNKTYKQ